jgi:putative ABC transport system permease protein
MRALRLLHLRYVRRHPLRSVIAVVAVASGVAITVTTAVVQASTARSFEAYARSFAGPAPLRVVGPVDHGGLRESIAERVDAVEGVASVVPVVQAVAVVDGHTERDIPVVVLGYDCTIRKIVGEFACDPSAIDTARSYRAPITSTSLAERAGPDGTLFTNDGPKPLSGASGIEALNAVNNGNVLAVPIHVAQKLFTRPDAIDVAYVIPEEGTEIDELKSRLEASVGEQNFVLTRDELPPSLGFFTQLYVLLGVVGIGTIATGSVLAHNALALSLEDRRRDLAVASAVGASPRTIAAGALAEGVVLGVVGGLLGAAVGTALAYPVLGGFQFFTERWAGLRMSIHITAAPFITGALLGVLVGAISAYRPARTASRIDVVAELQRRDGPAVTKKMSLGRGFVFLAVGLASIAGANIATSGGALHPMQPIASQAFSGLGVVMFIMSISQFAPTAFRFGARFGRRSPPVRLAWANLVGDGWRSASLVLAAGSAVMAGSMIANMGRTVLGSIEDEVVRSDSGSVMVSTVQRTNSLNLDAKPSPALAEEISRVEGVGRVRRMIAVSLAFPNGFALVRAIEGETPTFDVLRGRSDPAAFERGEVVIGPALARRESIAVGDTFDLPSRDGPAPVKVQGIVADGDSTGLTISMTPKMLEQLWGPQPPGTLIVDPVAGLDPDELAERIAAANLHPKLRALSGEALLEDVRTDNNRFFAPFWALQRALIAIAFAAMLSNLLLVGIRRKREFGLVAAVGMDPRGLARMVVFEALAIGAVAVILSTIAAMLSTEAFRHALFVMIPYPMPLRIDAAAPFLYGAITLVVLVLAALWPAWRTSRLDVVEALRAE